jgi:uncharacterized repeat protein (TIGR01451 family)
MGTAAPSRTSTRVIITFIAALSLLASQLAIFAAQPANADHAVSPAGPLVAAMLVSGNPSCAALGYTYEFKVDEEPTSGKTYTASDNVVVEVGGSLGFEVTMTTTDTAAGQVLSFSANLPVWAVIVKGGPNANVYDYAATSLTDVTADANLHAPEQPVGSGTYAGLSHVSFCFDDPPEEPQDPAIELVKRAVDAEGDDITAALAPGDSFTYELTVSSTGDVPATNVVVEDTVPAVLDIDAGSLVPDEDCSFSGNELTCDLGEIADGSSVTITFDVTVPTDIAADDCTEITNDATVTADGELSDDDTVSVTIDCPPPPPPPTFDPSISLVKTATGANVPTVIDEESGNLTLQFAEDVESGEVTYSYLVTNTGDEALTDLTLIDDVIDPDGTAGLTAAFRAAVEASYGGPILPVDGQVTVEAFYTTTAADLEALTVINVAVVAGVGEQSEEEVDATDTETIDIVQIGDAIVTTPDPAIDLVKVALIEPNEAGEKVVSVGDDGTAEVTYRYTITNTGGSVLSDLTLVDDVIGDLSELIEVDSLEPDASTTVEVTYTTTAADLDAGQVVNVAVTTGTDPEGTVVDADDDETVVVVQVLGVVVVTQPDPPASLPETGADASLLTGLGLLLSALGCAVLAFTPGRHRQAG